MYINTLICLEQFWQGSTASSVSLTKKMGWTGSLLIGKVTFGWLWRDVEGRGSNGWPSSDFWMRSVFELQSRYTAGEGGQMQAADSARLSHCDLCQVLWRHQFWQLNGPDSQQTARSLSLFLYSAPLHGPGLKRSWLPFQLWGVPNCFLR